MADILEALGAGIVFKVLFLIYNAVRFALLLIVAGQTLIKGSDFLFHIRLRPPFFQNVKMAVSPLFQGFLDHRGCYVYAVNPYLIRSLQLLSLDTVIFLYNTGAICRREPQEQVAASLPSQKSSIIIFSSSGTTGSHAKVVKSRLFALFAQASPQICFICYNLRGMKILEISQDGSALSGNPAEAKRPERAFIGGSMINWNNLDTLNSFKELSKTEPVDLPEVMSGESGAERALNYSIPMAEGLSFNYAASAVDEDILAVLVKLAGEAQLSEKFEALYNGEVINTGENRLVLHQLCRGQLGKDVVKDGVNKREFYVSQQKRIADFADKVHSGRIVNEKGEKFTTVVQIGIGGSDLGPRAIYIALKNWAAANGKLLMNAEFISNVDPDDAAAVLKSVDVAHTIFILVSKSGTTLETLTNEAFVKDALTREGYDPSKHMIAVTSETSPLAHNPGYLDAFYMDDYIGGRYSVSSAVGGAVLSLAFGPEVFAQFLDGAAAQDKNAAEKDPMKNSAMLDALIGVYYRNVLGYPCTAVLPYSQALSRFPAHLQQVDMESNGKSVNRFGKPIDYVTGPVIFGEPGTNGQHSFYQLLHQGKTIIPLQFVGFKKNQIGTDVVIEGTTSQQKLCANVAAQIVAFACGKKDENKNKNFEGGRPSSIIIGDQLTPRSLGALLSHFENKVMFQGFLWNVNSFDQEGVQLGKKLAKRVLAHDTDGALKAISDLLEI